MRNTHLLFAIFLLSVSLLSSCVMDGQVDIEEHYSWEASAVELLELPARAYYVSPSGNCDNPGTTPFLPLPSLQCVHDKIPSGALGTTIGDITIHVASGNYYNQRVVWQKTHPSVNIDIRPLSATTSNPVFHCTYPWGTRSSTCPEWFRLNNTAAGSTNITISNMTVRGYWRAIYLGNKNGPTSSNNRIEECYFDDIGDPWADSYSAIGLWNSTDNVFEGNTFHLVRSATDKLVHAIYLSRASYGQEIRDNLFHKIEGVPIKIEDGCTNCGSNLIEANSFVRSGRVDNSFAFQDQGVSFGNVFRANLLAGDYECDGGMRDVTCSHHPTLSCNSINTVSYSNSTSLLLCN